MNNKGDEQPQDRREAERKRLLRLRAKQPSRDDSREPGVLLSDAILHYYHWFELISPFDEKNLKPACYKLTIGDEYAIGGKVHALPDQPGSNEIRIRPFAVAIIKTKETINMPPFLIGRWNIQVSRAYQGLLWVGGPQVDAGYVGHLFCPVYNLSDKEVVLHRGEPIAVIDFEKTTKFHEGKSKPYPELPENILFEDYKPQNLVSGLVTQAKAKIDQFEPQIKSVQERVDNFVSLTFAVVAILFAAISVSAFGKGSPPWQYISVFLLSGLAIFFAASAWLKSKTEGQLFGRSVQVIVVIGLAVGFFLQMFWIRNQRKQIEELGKEIDEIKRAQSISTSAPMKTAMPPAQAQVPDNKKASPGKTNP